MSKKLVNGGLMIWEDYVRQFVLPSRSDRRTGLGEWASEVVGCRSECDAVPDPMLGSLLAQERAHWSAGASMNAIVLGLPWPMRVVLYAELMGYSDAVVAEAIGAAREAVGPLRRDAHKALVASMKRHASVCRALGSVYGLRVKTIV